MSSKLLALGVNHVFRLQANTILERHFLIGESLNMDQLVNKSKEEDGVKFYKTTFHVEELPENAGTLNALPCFGLFLVHVCVMWCVLL